jgi:hypothetical protein
MYERVPECGEGTPVLLSFLSMNVYIGHRQPSFHPNWLACLQTHQVVDDEGRLKVMVVHARDPVQFRRMGICILREDGTWLREADQLERTLTEELQPWTGPRPQMADAVRGHCAMTLAAAAEQEKRDRQQLRASPTAAPSR